MFTNILNINGHQHLSKISNPQTPGPTGTGTHSLWKAAVPVLFVFAGRRLME